MNTYELARQEAQARRAETIKRLVMGATEQRVFAHELDAIEAAGLARNALDLHLAALHLERELELSRGGV